MSRADFSILGIDEGENGMLMYVPHQMKLLIKKEHSLGTGKTRKVCSLIDMN